MYISSMYLPSDNNGLMQILKLEGGQFIADDVRMMSLVIYIYTSNYI